MLHKQSISVSARKDLWRVYGIKLKLLSWLLRSPKASPLLRVDWTNQFGQDVGRWFVRRLSKNDNTPSEWARHVETLRGLAFENRHYANRVLRVLANDARVGLEWRQGVYRLQFTKLKKPWRKAVGDVCTTFYEWFCTDAGYDEATFHLNEGKLNRLSWLRGIDGHVNGHCGYCGAELGDDAEEKFGADCEHFFPRDQWPHLCIHPYNLYLACGDCNSFRKGRGVPASPGPTMLSCTYHPELQPADATLTVKVFPAPSSLKGWKVETDDQLQMICRNNLVSLLELESRWEDRLKKKTRKWLSEWNSYVEARASGGGEVTRDWISNMVASTIERCRDYPFEDAHMRLRQAHAEYVISNPAQLQALSNAPNPVPLT